MSNYEKNLALRQGHGIASEDGYFEARPQIDSMDRRKVFGAGFERGWEAALAAEPAQERIQALELEVRQLTEQIAWLRHAPTPQADSQTARIDCGEAGCAEGRCGNAKCLPSAAPLAAPDAQMIAEYGIKASRMMARDLTRFDAACEVDKYLREQGAPGYYRHRMSIILFGNVEGTEASRAPENEAPKPSPTPQADSQPAPIDMVLHCPACGLQHIDAPDAWRPGSDPLWDNPPHRSHLCHGCGHIWRPADVPTNGMEAVKTRGKADSPMAARAPADSVLEDAYMLLQDVAACFTRDDDLPDNLLPRIDAALKARKQGANHDL